MNKFEKVLSEIGHVVEWPFVHTAQFVKLLDEVIKDEPVVKSAITGLVAAAERAITDTEVAVNDKGVDIPADILAVTDAESFFAYFKNSFLPVIEAAYKALESDTK